MGEPPLLRRRDCQPPYRVRGRNDKVGTHEQRPLVLSLSKDGCRWFDKLTMTGGLRTLKRPCDGTGAPKNCPQSIGKSCGGWTTKIHMVAADARTAIMCSLYPGQAHDAPEERKLLTRLGPQRPGRFSLMGRA